MTYKSDKDDNGDRALSITAIIRNDTVELDWLRSDDDIEAFGQRCSVSTLTLAGPNRSLLPRTAALTLMLHRQGNIVISGMACDDDYRDEAMRLAKEAALALYDEVYPDVAVQAQAFVEERIENVRRLGAVNVLPCLETGWGKQLVGINS
jgi:hypothetical protein